MEGYRRNLINTAKNDEKSSERTKGRLRLTKICAEASLAHRKKDHELKGESIDSADEESALLLKAENAYDNLVKVEEYRKLQGDAMTVLAQVHIENELSDKLVKEVATFLKLGKTLEKEENLLHHFLRDEVSEPSIFVEDFLSAQSHIASLLVTLHMSYEAASLIGRFAPRTRRRPSSPR